MEGDEFLPGPIITKCYLGKNPTFLFSEDALIEGCKAWVEAFPSVEITTIVRFVVVISAQKYYLN